MFLLVFGFGFLLISGTNSDVVSALGRKLCETHDLLCGRGLPVEEQWRDCSEQVEDPALRKAIQSGIVSFVQEKIHLHQQDS